MKSANSLLLVLCTFLYLPVFAQTDFGLKGEFYNSKDLSGTVVRTRIDKTIDFDFGYQAPITGINIDNFSARWTGLIAPPVTTTYTFSTYSDDGVRLWVNGVKVIDNWTDHAPIYNDSAEIILVAGQKYEIKLEYFEGILGAQIQLYWAYPGQARQLIPATQLFHPLTQFPQTPVAGNGTGLRADYYPNLDLAGDPVATSTEANVNNDWGSNAPAVGVGADQFTARWRGQVQAPVTGEIVFSTVSDDGVRLWIDGQLLISNWGPHGATTNYADPVTLVAGQKYDIRMEYMDYWSNAVAKLNWSYFGQSEQAIPQRYLYPASSVFSYSPQSWLDLTPENKDASRFLQQSTFGASVQEILNVRAKGYDTWLAEQFNLPQTLHQDYLNAIRDTGQRIYVDKTLESFWSHAIGGQDQLRQRVAFALSEIFVVSQLGGGLDDQPWATASYLDMLGKNAFGNYRQLLEGATLHPAMGKYLDMLGNEKEDAITGRTPNENYAREVLQLFSIGLYQLNTDGSLKLDAQGKPIQTYDQDEVKGFARVFTGWNWGNNPVRTDGNWSFPPYQYNWDKQMQAWPTRHSTGEKLVLNGVTISSGQTPEKDLQDALDNIFNHPNVGPFIGRQLIQRLVTSNPSPEYLTRVAAAFNNNGSGVRGDMKAVIKAILLDPEARSIPRGRYGVSRQGSRRSGSAVQQSNQAALTNPTNLGRLREPILRFTALLRAFNAQTTGNRYRITYSESTDYGLGQSPLRAPSVFNFYEPSYASPGTIAKAGVVAPEFKLANETTVIGSANYFRDVIYWGHYFWNLEPVSLDYSTQIAWTSDTAKMIDQLNLLLMGGTMTDAMRASVLSAVNDLTPRQPGERLRAAIYLIVTSKEFVIQK